MKFGKARLTGHCAQIDALLKVSIHKTAGLPDALPQIRARI